jgi:hypothetical protein
MLQTTGEMAVGRRALPTMNENWPAIHKTESEQPLAL